MVLKHNNHYNHQLKLHIPRTNSYYTTEPYFFHNKYMGDFYQ